MSSDLFVFENSLFSDVFSPLTELAIDPLLEETRGNNQLVAVDHQAAIFNGVVSDLISSSPPSVQLENLSLRQLRNAVQVKNEEFSLNFDNFSGLGILPQADLDEAETAIKLMQRSYSSNSFENKHDFSLLPRFDCVLKAPNLHNHPAWIEGSNLSCGIQIRKVCSTGDLQNSSPNLQSRPGILSSSPLSTEKPLLEEANFKVGRYTAEERKERIHRYRAKRTQRNFNKTIKYVCRKTLADNRPRVRGRFARNDEPGEPPKASSVFNMRYEDEDDQIWMEGLLEELYDDEGRARGTKNSCLLHC